MVDYSKFDKLTVDSSDSEDAAMSTFKDKALASQSTRPPSAHQWEGFPYPIKGSHGVVPFDVRNEVCRRFGHLHGDVVITGLGIISTVIGVYDGMLWFHMEGSDGAGIWDKETVKKVGRTTVKPGPTKEAPSMSSDWLKLDFSYTAGTTVSSAQLVEFDTRDDVCMSVGGFKHGQVLEVPGCPKPSVTIGVRRCREKGPLALWFHVRGAPGAGIFQPGDLKLARVTGCRVVREHAMPHTKASPASPRGQQERTQTDTKESPDQLKELSAERKARKEAEAENKKLHKKLEQLRASNAGLIKSTNNSERQAERKDRLKRDVIAREVEVETKDRPTNYCTMNA